MPDNRNRYGWFYSRADNNSDVEWDMPVLVYRIGPRGAIKGFECSFSCPSEMRKTLLDFEPDAEIIKIPPGYHEKGRWIKEVSIDG